MDVLSAIQVVGAGVDVLSKFMPNRGNRPQSEFSQVLEQSMGQQLMQRLDLDSSGTLTLNETKMSEKVFRQLDANADGQLSEVEINTGIESMRREAGLHQKMNLWLEAHDANHDGLATQRESGLDTRVFDRGDRNGDGKLDVRELVRMSRLNLE